MIALGDVEPDVKSFGKKKQKKNKNDFENSKFDTISNEKEIKKFFEN